MKDVRLFQTPFALYATWVLAYERGFRKPRYPVPAVITHVGWQPRGANRFVNRAYWWVCSGTWPQRQVLSTFWQGLGEIREVFDPAEGYSRKSDCEV